ncbi:AIPR family protein [Kitasatospora sp. NPDC048286]|uniref:AIPR family protein n=1 Tax=Kitasatospora sp. NPDC048286 TaxID=3364047 RepID=UPI00371A7628
MASNDLVLIDQILAERQAQRATPLAHDVAFETFACEQALYDRGLSDEEVESGVIGGNNDGAIDGVYVFLGDRLLEEDSDVFDDSFSTASVEVGTKLTLWLVQAKTTTSFTENAIDLVASSSARLLDLSADEKSLGKLYSEAVIARVRLFRDTLRKLATRHPKVEVRFSYVTRGETSGINTKVLVKAKDLESQFGSLLSGASGEVEFLGPVELWKRASTRPSYTLELPYQESITHDTSHIALVPIRDYLGFLGDGSGSLRRHIFDWNVRDYQGDVEVNKEIVASLLSPDSPEFWWLNNGVTIICSKASAVGKKLILDDVQIVNGLQTSFSIFNTLSPLLASQPEHSAFSRLVQVRILVTEDPVARDSVIRATNRQTSVPVASLRATDDIQRKIESYFLDHDWFYDRRKNFYRNIGKSSERIVSIPLLAQATMAMGLGQPDYARARPSSLLKADHEYQRVFSEETPLPVYLWLAQTQHKIDAFLHSEAAAIAGPERTNLRFHFAMLTSVDLMGKRLYNPKQLRPLAERGEFPQEDRMVALLAALRDLFTQFQKKEGAGPDKAAKSAGFATYVLSELKYL